VNGEGCDLGSRAAPPTHRPRRSPLDPILLTSADYYGTLAAARHLGARGVAVTMADPRAFAPASWSRHVARRLRCPSSCAPAPLLAWLLDYGARHPGHVLLPTCDDLAWLFSSERERLGRLFKLDSPPADTMGRLLDKRRLAAAAAAVGLATPETWCPSDEAEVAALAPRLPYPIIVKPRTQVYARKASKGVLVASPETLLAGYRTMLAQAAASGPEAAGIPDTDRPMLQAYLPASRDRVYELSGFVDEGGGAFVARAAWKIVQRPRRMGIGLCFEEAPIDHRLVERTARLCREVGFHGIFNVEFLEQDGERYLIDFNPRMYNQMAFDVARGLPLPWLAYLAAAGRRSEVRATADATRAWRGPRQVYCNWFSTVLQINAQALAGALPPLEGRRWRRWYGANRAVAVDPVADRRDWLPLVLDVGRQVFGALRHARYFIRQLRLEGVPPPVPVLPPAASAAAGPAAGPSVTAYDSLEALGRLGPELDALNLLSRRPTPFATMEYLAAFLGHDEHATPGQAPHFLVLRDGGVAIGWVALRLVRQRVLGRATTRVTFLTTHDVDRPGLVCRAADEARCADAIWRYLLAQGWIDAIELMAQDGRSPLLPVGRDFPGWRVRTFDSIPNNTIQLHHPTLPAWFGSLGKKYRLNVGRLGRRLLAVGPVELLTARHPEALAAFLDLYLDVERRSWKPAAGAGIARHPERLALFRSQCQPGRTVEPLIHLLVVDGVAVAGLFAVEFAGTLYEREITFDERYAALAPGNMQMLLSIGGAYARGLGAVNLLGFFGYYKARWGAEVTPTQGVQLLRRWSPPWVVAWSQAARRRLRPAAPATPGGGFNPARREVADAEASSAEALPDRQAERALLRSTLARLPAGMVERLSGAALEAALPFRIVPDAS